MAKLQSYYVLCPLIDQKSFLGISEDKEEQTVVVTLGRNVVNKYRLTDQKQTGGWTSKDHITAPVIYDTENSCYVGVFNNNTIKMWKEDSDNLDKVKKYKFPLPIFRVLPGLIIFANGNCASLTYALENRNSYDGKAIIKDADEIVAVSTCKIKGNNICYVVKNELDYEIIQCPLRVELGDMDKSKLHRVKVTRPDVYVISQLISASEKMVYILWSDSKITAYNLLRRYWKSVGTIPWVAAPARASLAAMGHNHVAAFGCSADRDGAIIVAYNVLLNVGSCKYPMKMYTADAKLYCFDDRIILEASNHIGILPYVIEERRQLSSLLGSHDTVEDDCLEIADWGSPTNKSESVLTWNGKPLKQGLSERNLCAQVINNIFEESNINCERIVDVLKQFKDVPESVVVLLINHVMKTINEESDASISDRVVEAYSQYVSEFNLLDYLLGITVSDSFLITYLRSSMSLDNALFLLAYAACLLKTGKGVKVEENKLLDWCTVLMDAFYQQYLMTKDEKVTEVLTQTLAVIKDLIQDLDLVNSTIALMHKLLYTKTVETGEDLPYSIELMEI
ncbi:nucleolar protein 11 [Cydia pomonella]|uniref:nucleolar protein 11 n=1 Tax=Cydia pomonella TaxID=82600 RepID=UPI002ADD7009|nr:nucleolar protein 11 [Cydia pomonella]